MTEDDRLLKPSEVAKMLNCSDQKVVGRCKSGQMTHVVERVGKVVRYLIPASSVREYLAERIVQATKPAVIASIEPSQKRPRTSPSSEGRVVLKHLHLPSKRE